MMLLEIAFLATACAFCAGTAIAGPAASDADKAFVAKVSQGGMYEVELGKVAAKQGFVQDIRDQGDTEAHDHRLVGEHLMNATKEAGITFPLELNAAFKARLATLGAMSGEAFDKAYIADMKKIHAADGAAFLQETNVGSNSALKSFAAETYNIVQRHVGELNATTRAFK